MQGDFSIVKLSTATLHTWLTLIQPKDASTVERLKADLHDRLDRVRVVLVDEAGPAIGLILETDPPGATIWTPRLRTGLSDSARHFGFREAAAYARKACQSAGIIFLESTIKGFTDIECAWRDAMLLEGFSLVARKGHYECKLTLDRHIGGDEPQPKAVEVEPKDKRIEILFAQTLEGSLDRSTVFEACHGGRLGDADRVFIISQNGRDAGLCALEHKTGSERGWIKYVGTVAHARRSGIAQELLTAGLTCLAANGVAIAECLIDVENLPSIALHERFGFRATGVCGDSYYCSLSTWTN